MAVCLLLLTGCTSDKAYRIASPAPLDQVCESNPTDRTIERLCFNVEGETGENFLGDYYLGFVEFDDQGWFHKNDKGEIQPTKIFQTLYAHQQNNNDQYLIVTYAHGWRHNASASDDNITSFRNLLERLSLLEHLKEKTSAQEIESLKLVQKQGKQVNIPPLRKARKVVGLFLSWRGMLTPIPLVDFWNRKDAAELVGSRSIKQFLIDLNEFKRVLNGHTKALELRQAKVDMEANQAPSPHQKGKNTPKNPQKQAIKHLTQNLKEVTSSDHLAEADKDETQIIMVGHSFGGLVMYHAVHSLLLERNRRIGIEKDGTPVYETAMSFGDFVLLVNPAFEGASYETIHQAATHRCYPEDERPIMAVVTSTSDWATRYAFPIARVDTLLTMSTPQADETEAVLKTVGHLDRYRTHRLYRDPTELTPIDEESALARPSVAEESKALLASRDQDLHARERSEGKAKYGPFVLERNASSPLPKNLPYLVISASPEIVNGHSDIWNPRFVNFMRSFILNEVMTPPKKHEQKDKPPQKEVLGCSCPPFGLAPTTTAANCPSMGKP